MRRVHDELESAQEGPEYDDLSLFVDRREPHEDVL